MIPDANAVLTAPTRLLIDDMPGVADSLHLGTSIVERKEGMWRAFEAAGVQNLSAAIRIEVVNRDPASHQGTVATRIGERKRALARVMDDQHAGIQRLDDLLASLAIHETSLLTVRYHLPAFKRTSDEVAVAAVYLPADNQPAAELLAQVTGDKPSWMAVARELSRALVPGQAPGLLATTLFVVLSAATSEEARSYLDEAGLPPLDDGKVAGPPAVATAGMGGTVSSVDTEADEDSTNGAPAAEDSQRSLADQAVEGDGAEGPQEGATEPYADGNDATRPGSDHRGDEYESGSSERPGNLSRTTSSSSGGGTSSTDVPRRGDVSGTDTRGAGDRKRRAGSTDPRAGRQTRLRSYVVTAGEDEGDRGTVGDEAPDLSPIDKAGVARVLEYERKCGREPLEMAHNNPGFDVESFDKRGDLVRRIEIKSTRGQWSIAGVMMSRRQHEKAVEDGDLFWLYVVENAQDDDFKIHRIQDPASKIDYFGFDGGWKDVAEPGEADSATP